jgi:hypothetical protein
MHFRRQRKEDLIARTQQERAERQSSRQREQASLLIQVSIRLLLSTKHRPSQFAIQFPGVNAVQPETETHIPYGEEPGKEDMVILGQRPLLPQPAPEPSARIASAHAE